AELALGVVEMEGRDLLDADGAVDAPRGRLVRLARAQIVAGREGVAGIEADADSLGLAHAHEDVGDLLESASDGASLPRPDFEQDPGRGARAGAERPVAGGRRAARGR